MVLLGDADCGGVAVVGDIEYPYLLRAACIVPTLVCLLLVNHLYEMSKCLRFEVKTVVSLKDRSSAFMIDIQVYLSDKVQHMSLSFTWNIR